MMYTRFLTIYLSLITGGCAQLIGIEDLPPLPPDAAPPPDATLPPDAAPADTFTMLYETLGSTCAGCHAENAVGAPVGTEATQDWSSVESARSSLRGNASGLMGNFAGCNGVPLLGDTPETSLLVAALDENVRADFSLAEFPDCNADAISDMTLKIGRPLSDAELSLLRQFVLGITSLPCLSTEIDVGLSIPR